MAQSPPLPSSAPLGAAGEHCAACGAALAADQRYCLNCGVRRAESRVPFPESLNGGAGGAAPAGGGSVAAAGGTGADPGAVAAAAAPAPAPAPAKAKRSWADRDLLLPVLGTALLAIAVGILIGRSGASDTINTKAPVVNVAPQASAGAAPAATTADASTDAAADAGADGKTAKAAKTTTEKAAPPANVSKSDLQNTATGKDYVNKSKKLPTEVSLGGTAPPKDNKPAGGGAEAETIG